MCGSRGNTTSNFLRTCQTVFHSRLVYIPINNAQKFPVPFCFDRNTDLPKGRNFPHRHHAFSCASHTARFHPLRYTAAYVNIQLLSIYFWVVFHYGIYSEYLNIHQYFQRQNPNGYSLLKFHKSLTSSYLVAPPSSQFQAFTSKAMSLNTAKAQNECISEILNSNVSLSDYNL